MNAVSTSPMKARNSRLFPLNGGTNFKASPTLIKSPFILGSWDRASLTYSSKTNKIQRYTTVFTTTNALHVSDGSSAHRQEIKTVFTVRQIPDAVYTVSSS